MNMCLAADYAAPSYLPLWITLAIMASPLILFMIDDWCSSRNPNAPAYCSM